MTITVQGRAYTITMERELYQFLYLYWLHVWQHDGRVA